MGNDIVAISWSIHKFRHRESKRGENDVGSEKVGRTKMKSLRKKHHCYP